MASEKGALKVDAVPTLLTEPAARGRPPPASVVTRPAVGERDGVRYSVGLVDGVRDSEGRAEMVRDRLNEGERETDVGGDFEPVNDAV